MLLAWDKCGLCWAELGALRHSAVILGQGVLSMHTRIDLQIFAAFTVVLGAAGSAHLGMRRQARPR